jgi:hypothetical protein
MEREEGKARRSCLSYRRTLLPQIRRRKRIIWTPRTPTIKAIPTAGAAVATALTLFLTPMFPQTKKRVSVGLI